MNRPTKTHHEEQPVDRRTAILLFGAVGASLAGCAKEPPPAPTPASTPNASVTPKPTPSPTPTPPPDPGPRWPLTGRPLGDPAEAAHAVIAVKVPDNRNEHPQSGINDADIVFVQLEGYVDARGDSATRLVPVFHSLLPERVAPVRSVRPVDVPLLAPMRAVVGNTGSSEWVGTYARQFGEHLDVSLTNLAARKRGAYSVDQSRVRTVQGTTYYDRAIVCHPRILAQLAREPFTAGPAQPYLPFAVTDADVSTLSGAPAATVRVPWKPGSDYAMGYEFDAGAGVYLRSMPWGPHTQAGGARVTTDNVLVVRAGQRTAKLAPGSGAPDPIHDIIDASGTFFYAHGGTYVQGTWAKGPVEAPFSFTLDDGRPLAMAPGRTFVELPNTDADVRFG